MQLLNHVYVAALIFINLSGFIDNMGNSSTKVSSLEKNVPMVVERRKPQENTLKELKREMKVALDHFKKLVSLDLTKPEALYRWNFKCLADKDIMKAKGNAGLIKELKSKLKESKSLKELLEIINFVGHSIVMSHIKECNGILPIATYNNLTQICPEWCDFD